MGKVYKIPNIRKLIESKKSKVNFIISLTLTRWNAIEYEFVLSTYYEPRSNPLPYPPEHSPVRDFLHLYVAALTM